MSSSNSVAQEQLRFERVHDAEYAAFIGERQVLRVRRSPFYWQAFTMAGMKLTPTRQYREEALKDAQALPRELLLDVGNVSPLQVEQNAWEQTELLLKQLFEFSSPRMTTRA